MRTSTNGENSSGTVRGTPSKVSQRHPNQQNLKNADAEHKLSTMKKWTSQWFDEAQEQERDRRDREIELAMAEAQRTLDEEFERQERLYLSKKEQNKTK